VTKEEIDIILEALGESAFAGLVKFVTDHNMKKVIEVAHVFDSNKLNIGVKLPTVRITIEPVQDGKFSKEYEEYRRKQLN
tara:strand:- start:781 stop:1020 length:240 start_codon:yes stop_codon:yes gene_type:complete